MSYHKNRFLKQWFTFTYNNDKSVNMIYSMTNNHYIQGWFEEHGYDSFNNILSKFDFNLFVYELNETGNLSSDDFNDYFPDSYIQNYSLWNMENDRYWKSKEQYRSHSKYQSSILLNKLFEVQSSIEHGWGGVIEYNIYYNH